MKKEHKEFGETRMVEVKVYINGKETKEITWDETLWIERGEDWYGLSSPELKDKKVRVIEREEWLKSKVVIKNNTQKGVKKKRTKKTKSDKDHDMSISSSVSTNKIERTVETPTTIEEENKERWLEWTTPIWVEENQRWEFYQKQEGVTLEIFHSLDELEIHDLHKEKIMTHIMAETSRINRVEGNYKEIPTGINVINKTHARNPKEGKQKADTSQFIHQELMLTMMKMKLEGESIETIESFAVEEYGVTRMTAGLYYTRVLENIREMARATIVDTLKVHLERYEVLFKWFKEEGYGRWALKVLERKEKLFGLHGMEELNMNLLDTFVEGKGQSSYNWNNLTLEERARLNELVKTTLRVLKPLKEEAKNDSNDIKS